MTYQNTNESSMLESIFTTNRRTHITLGAILILALVLRIYQLTNSSLWLDEVTTLTARANLPLQEIITVVSSSSPHPPIYFIALHYWLELAGYTPFLVRLFSVVFGVGAVFLTYLLGYQLFTRRTGLIGALLLAVSPLHIRYSQEARMYALLVFLALASSYFLIRLLQNDFAKRDIVGYAIFTVLLLYTHLFGIFIILSHNIFVVGVYMRSGIRLDRRVITWIGLELLIGATFLPWLLVIRRYLFRIFESGGGEFIGWLTAPTLETLLQTFLSYSGYGMGYPYTSNNLPVYLFSYVFLFTGLVLVGIAFIGYRPKKFSYSLQKYLQRYWFLLILASTVIFVPYVLSILITPIYHTRFILSALPAFYLLISRGIVTLRSKSLRQVITIVLVVGLLATAGSYYSTASSEQWEDAGNYIDSNAASDEVVFLTPTYLDRPMKYYTDRSNINFDTVRATSSDFDEGPRPTAKTDKQRFWIITTTAYNGATGWLGEVNESYQLTEYREFGQIQVYLYTTETNSSNNRNRAIPPISLQTSTLNQVLFLSPREARTLSDLIWL